MGKIEFLTEEVRKLQEAFGYKSRAIAAEKQYARVSNELRSMKAVVV